MLFVVIKKLKSHLQLSHTHSMATMKLRSITSHVSDLDVYEKTQLILSVKLTFESKGASVYSPFESFLSKMACNIRRVVVGLNN